MDKSEIEDLADAVRSLLQAIGSGELKAAHRRFGEGGVVSDVGVGAVGIRPPNGFRSTRLGADFTLP
jgi:hypothetical protein